MRSGQRQGMCVERKGSRKGVAMKEQPILPQRRCRPAAVAEAGPAVRPVQANHPRSGGPVSVRKRDYAMDYLRVAAMLGVIMIHVSSRYVAMDSSVTFLGANLPYWFNQISRFSVPLFILLSGAALNRSQMPLAGAKGILAFYRRRCWKILPAYVVWTLVYYLEGHGFDFPSLFQFSFLRELLLGSAAPHLYFIIVLLQCYLLYPLLRHWMERAPFPCLLVSFLITFCSQMLLVFRSAGLDGLRLPAVFWQLVPAWLFYFMAGMALTPERMTALRQFSLRNTAVFLPAGLVLAVFAGLEGRVAWDPGLTLRPLLLPYQFITLPALLAAWGVMTHLPKMAKLIGFLARHSMTIYFGHVLVLGFLWERIDFPGTVGFGFLYLSVLALASVFAAVLDRILSRLKR